jgi:hypothetical protein
MEIVSKRLFGWCRHRNKWKTCVLCSAWNRRRHTNGVMPPPSPECYCEQRCRYVSHNKLELCQSCKLHVTLCDLRLTAPCKWDLRSSLKLRSAYRYLSTIRDDLMVSPSRALKVIPLGSSPWSWDHYIVPLKVIPLCSLLEWDTIVQSPWRLYHYVVHLKVIPLRSTLEGDNIM